MDFFISGGKMLGLLDKNTGEISKTNIVSFWGNDQAVKRQYVYQNLVVHQYSDDRTEVCYYPDGYQISQDIITDGVYCSSDYVEMPVDDKGRKFDVVDGVLIPRDDRGTIAAFLKTQSKSATRSIKNFYGYSFSNTWDYFGTGTFDGKLVERTSRSAIEKAWLDFRLQLQFQSPDVKIICTPEEHERIDEDTGKKALHLHFLMSGCDLKLKPARGNNASKPNYEKFLYTEFGHQLFNICGWRSGFSTVALINPEDNQLQVANYVGKYITKALSSVYNGKRYFHTSNLDYSDKQCGYTKDIMQFLDGQNFREYKKTKNAVIYRNFEK